MVKRIAVFFVLIALLLVFLLVRFGSREAAPEAKVDALSWMAGYWTSGKGKAASEELWLPPAEGVMIGIHRDRSDDGGISFEYLRIEGRPDGVFYVAGPGGGRETEFRLVEIDDKRALFENREHDFPQRIRYRLVRGALRARIEGIVEGGRKEVEWTWRPAKLGGKR